MDGVAEPGDLSVHLLGQPSVTGRPFFVACNKSSEIVEVDAAAWKVTRRIPARAEFTIWRLLKMARDC